MSSTLPSVTPRPVCYPGVGRQPLLLLLFPYVDVFSVPASCPCSTSNSSGRKETGGEPTHGSPHPHVHCSVLTWRSSQAASLKCLGPQVPFPRWPLLRLLACLQQGI